MAKTPRMACATPFQRRLGSKEICGHAGALRCNVGEFRPEASDGGFSVIDVTDKSIEARPTVLLGWLCVSVSIGSLSKTLENLIPFLGNNYPFSA